MGYVVAFLGINIALAAAFVAGWIIGPRVITPLIYKLLGKTE